VVAGNAVAQIFRRVQASEGAEVMVEMRLIEVSADVRNVCPVNIAQGFNPSQDVVEPPDAPVALWREADFVQKWIPIALKGRDVSSRNALDRAPDTPLNAWPPESSVKTASSVGAGITCSRWCGAAYPSWIQKKFTKASSGARGV
jgi:hypothetical protein